MGQLERRINARSNSVTLPLSHSPLTPCPSPLSDGPALRLGFRLVKGLPLARAEAVVAARQEREFRSVADFVRRSGVSRALATRLAVADAFRSLGLDRRAALWHALSGWQELPLFAGLEDDGVTPPFDAMPLNPFQRPSSNRARFQPG